MIFRLIRFIQEKCNEDFLARDVHFELTKERCDLLIPVSFQPNRSRVLNSNVFVRVLFVSVKCFPIGRKRDVRL